ncbi:MAG: helix-turn-helix transcriptional regulator [Rhodospirillales bacterium]
MTTQHAADRAINRPITWQTHNQPAGHVVQAHTHDEAQLLYPQGGVMTVETKRGLWVVPSHRAVWIPPNETHAVMSTTTLNLHSLKFDTRRITGLPTDLTVLAVPALLRELILALENRPTDYDKTGPDGRLLAVILDHLRALEQIPLHLPYPASPRLTVVAEQLSSAPGDTRSSDAWAAAANMSARTFARHFQRETGMTFGQWRQQARLLAALQHLAAGDSIAAIAAELGYESQSAFIAMFRKSLGTTPGRYFAERDADAA